jgi:hypothetical protein
MENLTAGETHSICSRCKYCKDLMIGNFPLETVCAARPANEVRVVNFISGTLHKYYVGEGRITTAEGGYAPCDAFNLDGRCGMFHLRAEEESPVSPDPWYRRLFRRLR